VKHPTGDRGYEKTAHLYDLFDRKPNVDFFARYASRAGEILDVGAGTGRTAIPLAERGVEVFCVEPSPAMRREFAAKLAQRPDLAPRIQLVAGDARSFDARRAFPAAMLSGTFDHFLDDEERVASLANIGCHLPIGGTLVLDVFLDLMQDTPPSPAGSVRDGESEFRRFVGGRLLPGGRKEAVLLFETYRDGRLVERVEERSLAGVTTRDGVHRVLEAAGFEVRQEWGGYDLAGFQEDSPLLIVEAVKTAGEARLYDPGKLVDGELELRLYDRYGGDPRRGYIPAYRFRMTRAGQDETIGFIELRLGNTKHVVMYGGHIGYRVLPEHRGHRYAARSCKLLLPTAKRHGLNPLWITCNPDNVASRRTCEIAGGRLAEIVDLPSDTDMYQRGERAKCRYRFDL
jgi:predicted acetyltransferase